MLKEKQRNREARKLIRRMDLFLVFLLLCFFLSLQSVIAKPYIPKNDSQVLEKLTTSLGKPISKEIKKFKVKLSKNPKDINLAKGFVENCIEIFRQTSDPRYLGYAESALKPFLNGKETPPEIFILYATLLQSNHDFKKALEKLSEALKKDIYNSQAWLTKASILQTIGDYERAKTCCLQLVRFSNNITSIGCASSIGSLSGQVNKSYKLLDQILNNTPNLTNDEKTWLLTILSDTTYRLGNITASEKYIKDALVLKPNDNYLLTFYSDLLLHELKNKEVISLLKDKTYSDSLLLRLTIAEKALNLAEYKFHKKELKDRFNANHLRGDFTHLREEALFELKVSNNSQKALELAKKNWIVQKEPIDARILLESAIASDKKNDAKEVIKFLEKTKLEDVYIGNLVSKEYGK